MSGENTDNSSQYGLDSAREQGLRVVLPSAFELLIDIDNKPDLERFTLAYDFARRLGMVDGYSAGPSKSGGERRHITVRVPLKVTPLERIALQAILGSDWRRELLSLDRLNRGDAVPTMFFEKP